MMGTFVLGVLPIPAVSVASKLIFNASSKVVEKGRFNLKQLKRYYSYKTIKKKNKITNFILHLKTKLM